MILPPLIFEQQTLPAVAPEEMDRLWSLGWRHFGRDFFRYSISLTETGTMQRILPLRLDVTGFQPTKSQRRVLRKNADIRLEIAPAMHSPDRDRLFLRHRERFTSNIPESLRVFLPEDEPHRIPCECQELRMWQGGSLLAISYLDIGAEAVSSVYAMFEPLAAPRSPGIFTLLQEIAFARSTGRRWLYPGYATVEPSHYDYKKLLPGVEAYDWRSRTWHPLAQHPACLPGET